MLILHSTPMKTQGLAWEQKNYYAHAGSLELCTCRILGL